MKTCIIIRAESPWYIKYNRGKIIKAAVFYKANDCFYECDAQKTDVLSTVGAGDSFSAAFLSMYLAKKDISKCLEFASKVSAFVVSQTETVPEYDVNTFMKSSC